MDQVQIGKFIAQCRRECGLTQVQLAEQLGISDRAVSKWETGRSLPDASLMMPLCEILHMDLNELFSGRRIDMENYKKTAEENLLEMKAREEQQNRRLLWAEYTLGGISVAASLMMIIGGSYLAEAQQSTLGIILCLGGTAVLLAGCFCALKLEHEAGYYECPECGTRYVPKYWTMVWAMHLGTTRKMTCPHCGKRAWQKKVMTKD